MWNTIFSSAWAQDTANKAATAVTGSAQQQPPFLASFAPFILIFVVFYFLLIRPQKKKIKEEQDLIASLGKGDEVYTKSGLIGTISGLTEKVVTLEVADGVKIKILRSYVAGLAKKIFENNGTANSTPAIAGAGASNFGNSGKNGNGSKNKKEQKK